MIKFKSKKELNCGLMSIAYLLDEKYIQLVGKREDAYDTYKDLKENADLLDGKITCVDYPHNMVLIERSDDYPYGSLVYPVVRGNILNLKNTSEKELIEIAKKLIEFNKQMHNSDIHWGRDFSINHELSKVNKNIKILEKYLTKLEIDDLKTYALIFANCLNKKKNFCITHGDLWEDNLIVDEKNRLTGVIDFGNMSYFLPEVDYASLWQFPNNFIEKMISLSDEDITKESVDLFIMHRELCVFEYLLRDGDNNVVTNQLKIIREVLNIINPQIKYFKENNVIKKN